MVVLMGHCTLVWRMTHPPKTFAPPAKGKRHEQLKAWIACHELTLAVYRITASWPRTEQYALTTQTRRAAYSAAANIAEGAAKRSGREFRRFLDMSIGSLAELSYFFILGRDLGYVTPEIWGEIEALRDHAGKLTGGLYRAIGRKADASGGSTVSPS